MPAIPPYITKSPSSSSSEPSCPKGRWTTRWVATAPASPTEWSSGSWSRSWFSAAPTGGSPTRSVRPPRFGTDAPSGSIWE